MSADEIHDNPALQAGKEQLEKEILTLIQNFQRKHKKLVKQIVYSYDRKLDYDDNYAELLTNFKVNVLL